MARSESYRDANFHARPRSIFAGMTWEWIGLLLLRRAARAGKISRIVRREQERVVDIR